MKVQLRHYTCVRGFALVLSAVAGIACAAAEDPRVEENRPIGLSIESGLVSFQSTTNVPGIEVSGKSTALAARVSVTREGTSFTLHEIDASVPVKSLSTGMKLRDEHMRKYIFTTPDGQIPDLHFEAGAAACSIPAGTHDFVCRLSGSLSIRGVARPLDLALQVKEQGNLSFRAAADGMIKLSNYGIPAPSQFGVTPANEVKVHLEFAARAKAPLAAKAGELQ